MNVMVKKLKHYLNYLLWLGGLFMLLFGISNSSIADSTIPNKECKMLYNDKMRFLCKMDSSYLMFMIESNCIGVKDILKEDNSTLLHFFVRRGYKNRGVCHNQKGEYNGWDKNKDIIYDVDIIQYLISNGANIHAKNKHGYTAQSYAKMFLEDMNNTKLWCGKHWIQAISTNKEECEYAEFAVPEIRRMINILSNDRIE